MATCLVMPAAPEIERLLQLGARREDIGQTGNESWTVLADPERKRILRGAPEDDVDRVAKRDCVAMVEQLYARRHGRPTEAHASQPLMWAACWRVDQTGAFSRPGRLN
jgi:hypothetical protein